MSTIQRNITAKQLIMALFMMVFFLVSIPINTMMLTQAIVYFTTGNSGGFWGAATYFWSNVFPIMVDWGSVIAANGGSIGEIIAGAAIGAAMSDPITLAVFGGITATA
ncbi:hypothetical protein EWF20_10780 [Sulfolobus sp. S-194]|uniref:hypothetical protein n=1 Tax=Sulfolobus sp. S-194 TaxID=2512240 RepID=UPI0014370059|nr:hypothetical protein [Sulfolobus sp. S-194]QIW24567.1 hypothetical protein EWF20_10780 [Sulfolobus sp. S-194]